jgi:hypothetical protein
MSCLVFKDRVPILDLAPKVGIFYSKHLYKCVDLPHGRVYCVLWMEASRQTYSVLKKVHFFNSTAGEELSLSEKQISSYATGKRHNVCYLMNVCNSCHFYTQQYLTSQKR